MFVCVCVFMERKRVEIREGEEGGGELSSRVFSFELLPFPRFPRSYQFVWILLM